MNNKKIAIITGASQGMGAAYAIKLAEMGYDIAGNFFAPNEEKLETEKALMEQVAEKVISFGSKIYADVCDVSDYDSCQAFINNVTATLGDNIDVLINNAGIAQGCPFLETSINQLAAVINVNLMGAINMCHLVAPFMVARESGCIINVGSTGALAPLNGQSAYTASKTGLRGLTKTLALELGKYNIRVNTLCPGPILTEMTYKNTTPELREQIRLSLPVQHLIHPEEIAEAVAFIVTNNKYTGQTLAFNCGEAML